MSRTVSINTMIQQLDGLNETADLTDWESGFVANIVQRTHGGKVCTSLTERQIDSIERIYQKHFA